MSADSIRFNAANEITIGADFMSTRALGLHDVVDQLVTKKCSVTNTIRSLEGLPNCGAQTPGVQVRHALRPLQDVGMVLFRQSHRSLPF